MKKLWWSGKDLNYNTNNELEFSGLNITAAAKQTLTPAFFYSSDRLKRNLSSLKNALNSTGHKNRILYAMKANRYAPLMTFLKMTGLCGIDACSPEEVQHAIGCGFSPGDISFTGTSVSNRDLDILLSYPDLMINCDSLSMIKRLGEKDPGRSVGIRINPAMGTGYGSNELLRYSGEKPTKFGIYSSEWKEALKTAENYSLKIERIHFHTGCGYLNDQLPVWERILSACMDFIRTLPELKEVNLGGGLGIPLTSLDNTLNTEKWAEIISRTFKGTNLEINVEPGAYIVANAGILVLEANTVEKKSGRKFIGVDGGFNLAVEPAFYKLPCEPVPTALTSSVDTAFSEENLEPATFAGNINEALDVWLEDHPFPGIEEGQLIAFLNAGAYASSMSSNHCMRGRFSERIIIDITQNN